MKWITELSDQEIMALKDEDIIAMVRRRCAEQGVKLLERPEDVAPLSINPDLTFYEVADHLFENRADAEALSVMLQKAFKSGYDYKVGYNYKIPERISDSDLRVKTVHLYSGKIVEQYRDELETYNKSKEARDEAMSEYKDAQKAKDEIVDELWEKVYAVREKYGKLENMRKRYAEYVELASKDTTLAWSFFEKAYGKQSAEDKAFITA